MKAMHCYQQAYHAVNRKALMVLGFSVTITALRRSNIELTRHMAQRLVIREKRKCACLRRSREYILIKVKIHLVQLQSLHEDIS